MLLAQLARLTRQNNFKHKHYSYCIRPKAATRLDLRLARYWYSLLKWNKYVWKIILLNSSIFRSLRLDACPRSNLKLPKPFAISLYFGSTVINIWFLVSHRILCLFWDVLRFPFQKITSLFVGIWTEHSLLIHSRRIVNLVIEWEGT